MSHSRLRFATLAAVFCLLLTLRYDSARARPAFSDDVLLARLRAAANGSIRVARHAETGAVRFIGAPAGQRLQAPTIGTGGTPEQAARDFLRGYGSLFSLRDEARDLTLLSTTGGDVGPSFVRFQQRYAGVPVLGGELIVQVAPDRAVASASGELLPDINLATTPALDAVQAREVALGVAARAHGLLGTQLAAEAPALWIFNPALLGGPGPRVNTLVWRVEATGAAQNGEPVRELVLVNAQSGAIALHFNQAAAGKQRLVCDAQGQVDSDNNPNTNCDEAGERVRIEGQAASGNADIDLAYDYSGITYDFYQSRFGRDGIDGKGLPLISLVRYCTPTDECPYQNAFWNGRQMTYGTGFAAADDVVAHELTHGVTQFSSNLFYYYQSGAINESLSDIFGEIIDQTDNRGNDAASVRWQLGEDLPASIGVVRDMRDPTLYGDPDRTGSSLYKGYAQDNGGVHSNSGVGNKAAFLMADGGSFNGQTISGIGVEKTAQIFYRVNTALLTSAADYGDLGDALGAACQSLVGSNGIVAANCAEVSKVVLATQMSTTPANAAVPADAPLCASNQTRVDVFYDDMENPQSGRWASSLLAGPLAAWYYGSSTPIGPQIYATSGKNNLWGADIGGSPTQPAAPGDYVMALTLPIVVPANAWLHFRHAYGFDSDKNGTYDGGVLEYSANGGAWTDAGPLFSENGYSGGIAAQNGNPLGGRSGFVGASKGYYASRLNLGALAGKSVRFRFRIGTDPLYGSDGWFIDDLRVYTCGGATGPTATTGPAPSATTGPAPTTGPTATAGPAPSATALPGTVPLVMFASSGERVAESMGSVQLTVYLSRPATQPVNVAYGPSGGTASDGSDYTGASGTLSFAPGETSKTIAVTIVNDRANEPNETLTITLSSPNGLALGPTASATIVILDDDLAGPSASYRVYVPLSRKP